MQTTILIVDDEPSIADILDYTLRNEGFSTLCVGLGRDALEALHQDNDIAFVILDVGLPDMGGFDVCRELRKRSAVPVLFLTARADEVDRIVGLELGADDYVTKPFSPREVSTRVRAILRRARPMSGGTTPSRFQFDAEGGRIAYEGIWLSLTRYEHGLLAALLERPGHILSRAQLMDRVWSDAEESMERTVDAHVKTLRAKLRAVHESDPIETHRGLGYSIRLANI